MLKIEKNFLPRNVADEVAKLYEAATDWERVDQSATYGKKHQSFSGSRMPTDGDEYRTSFDRSDYLAGHPTIHEVVAIMGGDPSLEKHRCYRLGPGQGFRVHTDDYFLGSWSRSLYLSRSWAWDWGGILHAIDDEQDVEVVFPEFNLLATMDHTTSKMPHFVSLVAEWAKVPRYSLNVFGGG